MQLARITGNKTAQLLLATMVALSMQPQPVHAQSTPDLSEQPAPRALHRLVTLKFNVVLDEDITNKAIHDGETFEAHLVKDLKFNNVLLATAGTKIIGHVCAVHNKSNAKSKHPTFALKFDQVLPVNQYEFPIAGVASEQNAVCNNNGQMREIGVGIDGEVFKARSLESIELTQLALPVPVSLLNYPNRHVITLLEGDEITVQAVAHQEDIPSLSVTGKVLPAKSAAAPRRQTN